MLAQAVAEYHTIRFGKVAFAGSVVQTGFPWSAYGKRLKALRNYRASADLVVAALPSVFEHVRAILRVGGAGHAGFIDDFARRDASRYFADGGHGAVFGNKENYPVLVNYILDRSDCEQAMGCEAYELAKRTDTQSRLVDWVYRLSLFVWLGGILIVGALAYVASRLVRRTARHHSRSGHLIRSAVAGASVVGLVLTLLRYV